MGQAVICPSLTAQKSSGEAERSPAGPVQIGAEGGLLSWNPPVERPVLPGCTVQRKVK